MNKKLIFILIITLFSFSLSVFQYMKELQAELANAAYTSKPDMGHSWSEMECTAGLCVTAENNVGIGTYSPSAKLDVSGNIHSSGTITAATNICIGSGACLSDLNNYIGNQNLLYSAHTFNMCSTTPDGSGYGEVVNIGTTSSPVYICRFDAGSCPAGLSGQPNWTQYQSWSTASAASCSSSICYNSQSQYTCNGGCSVAAHSWSNTAYTCTYTGCDNCYSYNCYSCQPHACGGASQVGCY